MKLYKKFLKRLENGKPIYCNDTLAKELSDIAEKHYNLHFKRINIDGYCDYLSLTLDGMHPEDAARECGLM